MMCKNFSVLLLIVKAEACHKRDSVQAADCQLNSSTDIFFNALLTHFAIHCLASCTFAGTSPLLLLLLLLAGADLGAGLAAGAAALLLLLLLGLPPCFDLQASIQARASATLSAT